jgi:hypothetical protein
MFSALEIIYREWLCEAPTPVVIGFSGRKESEAALKEKPSGRREGGREGEGEGD